MLFRSDEDMSSCSSESSSQTYFPMVSDSEPPCLDFGWPVADWSYHLQGLPSVEVYFQSPNSASMKDLLREFIRKATSVSMLYLARTIFMGKRQADLGQKCPDLLSDIYLSYLHLNITN